MAQVSSTFRSFYFARLVGRTPGPQPTPGSATHWPEPVHTLAETAFYLENDSSRPALPVITADISDSNPANYSARSATLAIVKALTELVRDTLLVVGALFPIVNPVGNT